MATRSAINKKVDLKWRWPLLGDNLVIFYYLNASKIWPDKRGGLW
jgi:hypothetical protein